MDTFGLSALVAAGTLAAHQVGYLADPAARSMHRYLGLVGPAVLLIAFVGAWAAAIRLLRHDGGRAPSFGVVSTLQVALYLVMEVAERVAGESFASMWSAPFVLGMVVQPLVAFAALGLLRVSGRVLKMLAGPTRRPLPDQTTFRIEAPRTFALVTPRSAIRLRGPPLR